LANIAFLPFVLNPTSSNSTHSSQTHVCYVQVQTTHCWLGRVAGQNVAVCSALSLWLCSVFLLLPTQPGGKANYAFQTYFPLSTHRQIEIMNLYCILQRS